MIRRIGFGVLLISTLAMIFFVIELRNPVIPEHAEFNSIAISTPDQNGFRVEAGIPKAAYRIGEAVPIAIYVKNLMDQDNTLFFNSSQKYDLNIKNAANIQVWSWSKGRVFARTFEEMLIRPEAQAAFSYQWTQVDDNGVQVPAGMYILEVFCKAEQTKTPAVANIEIKP